MMLSRFGSPHLSYAQLFSFQVLYSNNADSRGYANAGTFGLLGRKKGEWKRAILEVDYTMGTLFLQDKDRIIMSETFEEYKRYKAQVSSLDDTLVSVRFKSGQWEIMAQNAVEKDTLQHLLECIVRDLGPQEAADLGVEKGLVGVNKEVMKYGLVQRRAKTAYKKDERFLLIVPGKLLLFKGMDIGGKHVRFVTSLFGASARLIYGQLEFEVIVPDSKSLNLLTPTAEELTGWIGAIEESVLFANGGLHEPGGQKSRDARANRRRDPENTAQEDRGVVGSRNIDPFFRDANIGNPRKAAVYANRSNDYEGGNFQRGANRQVVQREVAQRSEVCDFNLEDPVQSRRSGEVLNQRTERNPTYFRAEQRSRSNSLPLPSSVHSGDRDQNKAFDIEQQIKTRVNVASDGQEVLGLGNQSTKHARSPRKEFPDQRLMDNSVIIMESAEGRRREGRDFDEAESQAMFVRQGWSPSPGKGFVSQIQAGPSGANSDYSPGSTRAWDGNHSAFEDCSTSKGSSSLQTTSFYPELSQEGLSQASSSNPTELSSKSKRRSVKELEKMCFYLNLYRKGLTDSTTQTAS